SLGLDGLDVIFCETSNPTKRVIEGLRRCESPADTARIAALSADQAPTAIIGCPHMTKPCGHTQPCGCGSNPPSSGPGLGRTTPVLLLIAISCYLRSMMAP